MIPSRFTTGQSSAMRKSRLEGKQSFLPKLRKSGSIDRLSSELRRPSAVRSSSAEPPRGTMGAARLSREAIYSKIPINRRSRSQQNEAGRYGQAPITPKRSHQYSRATTTPQRTPSEDRSTRNWQSSLDRALAFVTVKDQRPISNAAWQRAEYRRVQEALQARGVASALMRPLTITTFVDITGGLFHAIAHHASRLSNDNYVSKVPHMAKQLLYPGTVSKSWLKTVNTLHAFPHALAMIAYLLDLTTRIEQEVLDEWLYLEKDELAILRREFLLKCWLRYQEAKCDFQDLDEAHLRSLRSLLGDDQAKIAELHHAIKKYDLCLEDAAEAAARAEEARRSERRGALLTSLRDARAQRVSLRATAEAARAAGRDILREQAAAESEIAALNAECQQLRKEVEEQPMSIQERTRLLDEMDYAARMQDSKSAAVEHITKMLYGKETELARWQKTTLDSCVEYNQGLIHLSVQYPAFGCMAINEKELMGPSCAAVVESAVTSLRAQTAELADRLCSAERGKNSRRRHQATCLDETRAARAELQSALQREAAAHSESQALSQAESARWAADEAALQRALDAVRARATRYTAARQELLFWEEQERSWCSKLAALRQYVKESRESTEKTLQAAKEKRAALVMATVNQWHETLDRIPL